MSPLPVRRLLCPIAADGHAAPPARVASGSINEKERAACALASLHVGEILGADKIGQQSREREKQRLG